MKIFDYIYYRFTKAYFKWDGRTGYTAILAVALMQALTLIGLVFLFIDMFYDVAYTVANKKAITAITVAFTAITIAINYLRYNGKYNSLKSRWNNEKQSDKNFRGILVVLALVIPWLFLIAIVIYRSK